MTSSKNTIKGRSRGATIFSIASCLISSVMLFFGYAALTLSFTTHPGDHPSDQWFGNVLFASVGFMFGIIALLCAAVPFSKRWWHHRWLYLYLALLALCFLRTAISAYAY